MKIIDLIESQIKQIYCAAMGWHSKLNILSEEHSVDRFDAFFKQIKYESDKDRWIIWADIGLIEITEDLYFCCGMSSKREGVGGTMSDLKAV